MLLPFRAGEGHRAEGGGGCFLQRELQARLAGLHQHFGRLEVGGQVGDDARRLRLGRDPIAPQVPPRDVVRVDERHGHAPRLGLAGRRQPLLELARDAGIHAPPLPGRAVW